MDVGADWNKINTLKKKSPNECLWLSATAAYQDCELLFYFFNGCCGRGKRQQLGERVVPRKRSIEVAGCVQALQNCCTLYRHHRKCFRYGPIRNTGVHKMVRGKNTGNSWAETGRLMQLGRQASAKCP